jgi:hypothetical protein
MRRAFRIYKVPSDRGLHFVKAKQTIDDAKARVRELGDVWPGEYVTLLRMKRQGSGIR